MADRYEEQARDAIEWLADFVTADVFDRVLRGMVDRERTAAEDATRRERERWTGGERCNSWLRCRLKKGHADAHWTDGRIWCNGDEPATPPPPRPATVSEVFPETGKWRCSGCGELNDAPIDPAWRWTGTAWQHRCASMHPQAGHTPARRVDDIAPPRPATGEAYWLAERLAGRVPVWRRAEMCCGLWDTTNVHEAKRFATKAECEAWMPTAYVATEHMDMPAPSEIGIGAASAPTPPARTEDGGRCVFCRHVEPHTKSGMRGCTAHGCNCGAYEKKPGPWKREPPPPEPEAARAAHERIDPLELLRQGGAWLGAARNRIKWHGGNGDRVYWGSRDEIQPPMCVAEVEEIAAYSAASAINEERAKSARLVEAARAVKKDARMEYEPGTRNSTRVEVSVVVFLRFCAALAGVES